MLVRLEAKVCSRLGLQYQARPTATVIFATVPLELGVALASCYVPARRATRIDSMRAITYE